jgi:hypothetical protein
MEAITEQGTAWMAAVVQAIIVVQARTVVQAETMVLVDFAAQAERELADREHAERKQAERTVVVMTHLADG